MEMQYGKASQNLKDKIMTILTQHNCASSSFAPSRRRSLRSILAQAFDLWRSRRALAGLSLAQLEDVGVTPREAQIEARRAVWDVPHSWRN